MEDPLVDENYSFLELALPLVLESHKHCMISMSAKETWMLIRCELNF